MKKLWDCYTEWRIRRLAVKLRLSGRESYAESSLDEATRFYRRPLPLDKSE